MQHKLLIIEDNENLGRLLERMFINKGIEISWARDGVEGWKQFRETKPSLALVDLALPLMSGYEILEERRADDMLSQIPVIVISNSGEQVEIDRLKSLGVTDYIVKLQITPEEVYDKVMKALDSEGGMVPPAHMLVVEDEPQTKAHGTLEGANVLWVEDDTFLSSIIERKLQASKASYVLAKSADQAFAAIEKQVPEVIVLDLMLPGMDGFEILEKLKADPKTKEVPVIVLSNLSQKEDTQKAERLGAAKFFVKALVPLEQILDEVGRLARK